MYCTYGRQYSTYWYTLTHGWRKLHTVMGGSPSITWMDYIILYHIHMNIGMYVVCAVVTCTCTHSSFSYWSTKWRRICCGANHITRLQSARGWRRVERPANHTVLQSNECRDRQSSSRGRGGVEKERPAMMQVGGYGRGRGEKGQNPVTLPLHPFAFSA